MKRKIIALSLCSFLALTGCSSSKNQNVANNGGGDSGATVENQATPTPAAENDQLSLDNFSFTEYKYEDDYSTQFLVAVKNNSNVTISLSANATAYDANNQMLGAADSSIDVLGSGEESVLFFYFDGVKGADHIDYKDNLQYGVDLYYQPVISNLSVQEAANANGLTVAITNNGSVPAEYVEVYAVYTDANGTPIEISSNYCVDSNSEIAPGATQSTTVDYYRDYDFGPYTNVTYYLTGRAEK